MSLHPEELTITDLYGDHFTVQDMEGDTVLELPILNQVEHNATLIGKRQGQEQVRRDLSQLLGLTPEGRTDRIEQRLANVENATQTSN